MSRPTITVTVSPDGETSVETTGYAGRACRDASAFIEKALGDVAREKLTAEFYRTQRTQRRNTHRA